MDRVRWRAAFGGLVALAALCTLAPHPAGAQSAADIVERMLSEYESRARGVDNYTIVQEVMGLETLVYFEKTEVDGRPYFRLTSTTTNGMNVDTPPDAGVDGVFMMGGELANRSRYAGRESVNDYDVHVLEIPDLAGLGIGGDMGPDADFTPKSGKMYLDVDTYAPRRMVFDGEMTNEQGTHSVTSTVDLGDYREVQGLLLPYSTQISIAGLGAAIDPEMRAQYEKMQEELAAMPEAQRAMVERMMAGQLEQFRAMMSDESAPMTMRVLVKEVRVNAGPPR